MKTSAILSCAVILALVASCFADSRSNKINASHPTLSPLRNIPSLPALNASSNDISDESLAQMNFVVKTFVTNAVSMVPGGPIISAFLQIFWPSGLSNSEIMDMIIDKINEIVEGAVVQLKKEDFRANLKTLSEKVDQFHQCYDGTSTFEDSCVRQLVKAVDIAEDNRNHVLVTEDVSQRVQLLPMIAFNSVIELSLLKELIGVQKNFTNARRLRSIVGTAADYEDRQKKAYDEYVDFFKTEVPNWKNWRNGKIEGSIHKKYVGFGRLVQIQYDLKVTDNFSGKDYALQTRSSDGQPIHEQFLTGTKLYLQRDAILNELLPAIEQTFHLKGLLYENIDKEIAPEPLEELKIIYLGPFSAWTVGELKEPRSSDGEFYAGDKHCLKSSPTFHPLKKVFGRKANNIDSIKIEYENGKKGLAHGKDDLDDFGSPYSVNIAGKQIDQVVLGYTDGALSYFGMNKQIVAEGEDGKEELGFESVGEVTASRRGNEVQKNLTLFGDHWHFEGLSLVQNEPRFGAGQSMELKFKYVPN